MPAYSNVVINRNCFKNPQATYEIGSELGEHAKWIDARENNWGYPRPELFIHRIFDQFNRYSLAAIEVSNTEYFDQLLKHLLILFIL